MKPALLPLALAALLPAVFAAESATVNPQDLLPPAAPWHGASEALVAAADDPWITPAEKTGLLDSPNYDDTIAYLRRLAAAAPARLSLLEFGRTAEDRPLYAVVASTEKSHTPAALRAGGKPTLLAQAGIHAGEIDGKDAGLMLLRDLALDDGHSLPAARAGKSALLARANFLFIPVLNADGHERASAWNRPNQRGPVRQGWRTTAQNLNLNRDYAKADAPEMRALLALLDAWQPTLYLDLHVTDGLDYQYDITFGYNGDNDDYTYSPHIAAWLNTRFRTAVSAALAAAGHLPGPLVFTVDDRNLSAGLATYTSTPRFSSGYGDLRHLASVLVENHSLKPYPQRVLGTYVLLESTLRLLGDAGADLATATTLDRAARPSTLPANWGNNGGVRRVTDFAGIAAETYASPASGADEVRWTGQPKTYRAIPVIGDRSTLTLSRPKAYYVPVSKPDVIARLRLHGIRCEPLAAAQTLELDFYRLVDPKPSAEPYEGRYLLTTATRTEHRAATFPAGSVRVPTDQPLGDLAIVLLEPESADSFLAWGFFTEILSRTEYIEGYVIAPLADQLLAANPALKAEFEQKLAADPKFAADRTARLQWFYARTKFYDDRHLLYPVGVER